MWNIFRGKTRLQKIIHESDIKPRYDEQVFAYRINMELKKRSEDENMSYAACCPYIGKIVENFVGNVKKVVSVIITNRYIQLK